ncbi:MerR family transcriptional regulator [Cellulomonas alba]|uniref:MerR family transcriptional regulator n=1 Tax=Cellulomonas alba TaxID=3053467 RepID=A0ABT7SDL7_9CELL|nr:MerR family transcriptional regulator [Cellulomonas alba]MDM7854270.1 MerR family transcriptional regulator [Cellulomonas alba]
MTTRPDAVVPAPALAVAAVARRLGVAPATLRTWDRRYGLGPSEHLAGAHRRYTAHDVERLLVMRRLTLEGVAPAEAARIALATDVESGDSAVAAWTGPEPTPTALVDAALAGDEHRCVRLLALGPGQPHDDVVPWWTELVEPATVALARRTVVDLPGVDAASTLRSAALAALRASYAVGTRHPAGRPVVLVLVPTGQPRPVVAHAVAAALASHGVDARIVGGPLAPHHGVELATMTRARATVLVGERTDADLAVVERLAADRADLPQFVMLPDAAAAGLPLGRSVHRARSFPGLVHEVLAVAEPHAADG